VALSVASPGSCNAADAAELKSAAFQKDVLGKVTPLLDEEKDVLEAIAVSIGR
jgi:hypothetical protein